MVIDLRDSTPVKTCNECEETEKLFDCVVWDAEEEYHRKMYKVLLCKECLATAIELDLLIRAEKRYR